MTRREFIKGAAATAGVAAVGGVTAVAVWDRATQPEDPAASWSTATAVKRILLAAALAPSSHNTQPWRFRVRPDGVDLLGDPDRTMGNADPRLRELHVSLGCALENAVVAAAEQGTPLTIEHVPHTRSAHLATLRFAQGATGADAELAAAIPQRRTNRGPYDVNRPISSATLEALASRASEGVRVVWLTSPEARATFSELSVHATAVHVADADMQRDSHRWYRMSRSEAEKYRDGITVSSANLPSLVSLWLGLVPPSADSFDAGWADATRNTHCNTATAFGLLVVPNANDRCAWVEAGRTYQRMQLAATLTGISTHPISQALAIRDREVASGSPGAFSAALSELGGAGEVVLAFRIGYPTRVQPPSLRRAPVVEGM